MKKYLYLTLLIFITLFKDIQISFAEEQNSEPVKIHQINNINIKQLYMLGDYFYILDKEGALYALSLGADKRFQPDETYGYTFTDYLSKKINIPEPVYKIDYMNNLALYAQTQNGTIYSIKDYDYNKVNVIPAIIKKSFLGDNNYIITIDGTIYAWGNNTGGLLGIGKPNSTDIPTKLKITEPVNDIIFAFDAYNSNTIKSIYALSDNGSLYSWGYNTHGELFTGDTKERISPVKIDFKEPIKRFQAINSFRYAITNSGSLYTNWDNIGILKKVDILEKVKDVQYFEIGDTHYIRYAAILTENGYIYIMHDPKNNEPQKTLKPIFKLKIDEPVNKIILNKTSLYAVTKTGIVYGWGENNYGQLLAGYNSQTADYQYFLDVFNSNPVKTLLPANVRDIIFINGLYTNIYSITNDGIVYSYGNNENGQLGVGDFKSDRITPSRVNIKEPIIKIISDEKGSIFALTNNKNLYVWGENSEGQLGIDSYEDINIPTKINISEPVKELYYKDYFSVSQDNYFFALTENNNLYVWGDGATKLLEQQDDILAPVKIINNKHN